MLAWSWGMTPVAARPTSGTGGGAGKVNVQDLSITKYVDKSPRPTCSSCAAAASTSRGDCSSCARPAARSRSSTSSIKLKDGHDLVGHAPAAAGGEDRLTETVALNFAVFKFEYTPQKADGAARRGDPGWAGTSPRTRLGALHRPSHAGPCQSQAASRVDRLPISGAPVCRGSPST